jgi:putative transposase
LAERQTRYVNKQENRTGSLWEGRYKVSIDESDPYILQCCRYIELNPVKAKMVAQPEHYRWLSYQENAGLSPPQIIKK